METMLEAVRTQDHGTWLTNGEPAEAVAQQWTDAVGDVATAQAWWSARCFDPASARALTEAGVAPQQAAQRYSAQDGMLGYLVANGDLSVAEAVRFLAESRS